MKQSFFFKFSYIGLNISQRGARLNIAGEFIFDFGYFTHKLVLMKVTKSNNKWKLKNPGSLFSELYIDLVLNTPVVLLLNLNIETTSSRTAGVVYDFSLQCCQN